MMQAIQTKQLSFQVEHFHLNDISVSFPSGQITSIVGPNGSGKSTLLRIISRLLIAKNGSVYIQNQKTDTFKSKEFAKILAMLPQSKGTLPNLTVKELVAYGRSPYKSFLSNRINENDEKIINEVLQKTNTEKHKDRLFFSLSGGEQQKVRIAMALAQKTNILLLDEPTTFLDITHQFELMELLQQINEEYKLTIVMVLHDLQQAASYSDYMIAMRSGEVVDTGPPENLLTPKFLHDVYKINARILFEDGFPLIVPNMRRNKIDNRNKYNEN